MRGPRTYVVDYRLREQLLSLKGQKKDRELAELCKVSLRTISRIMALEPGQTCAFSELILSGIATALGIPLSNLRADGAASPGSGGAGSSPSPKSLLPWVGEALLADARGDHQHASQLIERAAEGAHDVETAVAYRIVAARIAASLGKLEQAERLLTECVVFLRSGARGLVLARCAFDLALTQARRGRVIDSMHSFELAERTLVAMGEPAARHLMLVREHFGAQAIRAGDRERAMRLLREGLTITRSIEAGGPPGLAMLEQALLSALEATGPSFEKPSR